MTYYQGECSYRRGRRRTRFNVGRVLVLNPPPACTAPSSAARMEGVVTLTRVRATAAAPGAMLMLTTPPPTCRGEPGVSCVTVRQGPALSRLQLNVRIYRGGNLRGRLNLRVSQGHNSESEAAKATKGLKGHRISPGSSSSAKATKGLKGGQVSPGLSCKGN